MKLLALALLLAGTAGAESFTRIPDLAQLVVKPIRGEYFLVCQRHVVESEAAGSVLLTNREVRMPTNEVKLDGFPALTMRVMVHDWGLKTDPIATVIQVHLCVEDDTTYQVENHRGTRPDKTNVVGPDGVTRPRHEWWQQKTRSR